jgi:hypothetical protein
MNHGLARYYLNVDILSNVLTIYLISNTISLNIYFYNYKANHNKIYDFKMNKMIEQT